MTDINDLTADCVAEDLAERFDTAPAGCYTDASEAAFAKGTATGSVVLLTFSNADDSVTRRFRVTVVEV